MTHRVAVLFLTHRWNRALQLKFQRLARELDGRADAFVVIQKSSDVREAFARFRPQGAAVFPFDQDRLPGHLGYPYWAKDRRGRPALVPGSTHFPVLAFARRKPEYDHYFVIEFDVDYSGNWGGMVKEVTACCPDFASLHFFSFEERPDWHWWKAYRPAAADLDWASDRRRLRRSFNPVYWLSRHAVELIESAHRSGWAGHYELLLATILTQRGCKVADLRELGQFCEGAEQNPKAGGSVSGLSTVRWRPPVTEAEFLERSSGRTLFHPVKDQWLYDGARILAVEPSPRPVAKE